MTIAAVLLAAGSSTRFGARNKLEALLGGVPLRLHAARVLADLPFAARLVVTADPEQAWPGFSAVPNSAPALGMGHSIALGVAAAQARRADAVLIALADMPFVRAEHFRRLMLDHLGADDLVASWNGVHAMPPALFGSEWFERLRTLGGDEGARAFLKQARRVEAPPHQLIDIDRVDDLAAAEARLQHDRP